MKGMLIAQPLFQLLKHLPIIRMFVMCKIKGGECRPPWNILLTDTQLGDQSTVTVDVLVCQIVQHLAALTNHHQQTTTGVVVVLVGTRRKMLDYLANKDINRYRALIAKLGIRK